MEKSYQSLIDIEKRDKGISRMYTKEIEKADTKSSGSFMRKKVEKTAPVRTEKWISYKPLKTDFENLKQVSSGEKFRNILTILIFMAMTNFACVKHQTAEAATPPTDSTKVKTFQKININDLKISPDSLFSRGWFVVAAGDSTSFNEMTISWGALGTVWALPAVTIYIRNTRYTYQFLERSKYFTLCAFPDEYREKLEFIGSKSVRDIDKVAATGLTPRFTELGNPYFEEAWLVIECEKVYWNDIERKNLFADAQKMYANPNETHRMYVGGIVNVWEKR